MDLHVAILAGGRGERFWPWSRAHRPKQVLALVGDRPLLTATVQRARLKVPAARTWVVGAEDQRAAVLGLSLELPESQFLWEPRPRNTGPAIGAIATRILVQDAARSKNAGGAASSGASASAGSAAGSGGSAPSGDALVLVLPSDHWIPEGDVFWETVARAEAVVRQEDALVTFGLPVRAPETGYGYIERGEALGSGIFRSLRFHEKPDLARARAYMESGRFYWNAGIFLFRAGTIVRELARHVPAMEEPLAALEETLKREDLARHDAAYDSYFAKCPAISIDHAVMERADRVVIVEASFRWSDVGSWTSWAELQAADPSGNHVRGEVLLEDARGNVVCSADDGLIALLGVENLIVVRTNDVTLVCPRDRAQEIRELVARGKSIRELGGRYL